MMRRGFCSRIWPIVILWCMVAVISACAGAAEPAKPTIRITTLEDDSQVNVGQQVAIGFEAADVKGVTQVELTINGEPTYVEAATPPVNVFSGSYTWLPEQAGSYLIQVVTFNVDGAVSDPAQVAVRVEEVDVAAGPTPTIAPVEPLPTTSDIPTETPTVILVPPTPSGLTPTPTSTPEPDSAAVAETEPLVTAKVGLNVRLGPSTDYPVIGRLAEGETAEITGKDAISAWWQIVHTSESGDRGWVAAGEEFSTAANAEAIPVIDAPPLPEVAATATPDPSLPTIFTFTAERDTIAIGESVVLNWQLENAKEAYLRYNGREEGVVSPGSKQVSPNSDTVYTLVARNDNGETTAQVTIRVTTTSATPVPVRRDGRVTIVSGQAIDFDEGIIQDDSGTEIDFVWDFQQKGFIRRNGAIGVLVNESFNDISFDDCVSAPYGDPISGVDISGSVVGCYRTSADRLGKFVISAWDLSGKLTIDWLTWNN